MEGLHGRSHPNTLLHNTDFSPRNFKQLSKWGGLDQTVYIQDSLNNALSVNFLKYLSPQQDTQISSQ